MKMFKFKDYVEKFVEDFPFTADDLANPKNNGIDHRLAYVFLDEPSQIKVEPLLTKAYNRRYKDSLNLQLIDSAKYIVSENSVDVASVNYQNLPPFDSEQDYSMTIDPDYFKRVIAGITPYATLIEPSYVAGKETHFSSYIKSKPITFTPPFYNDSGEEIQGEEYTYTLDSEISCNIKFIKPSINSIDKNYYLPSDLREVALSLRYIKDVIPKTDKFYLFSGEELSYDEFISLYGNKLIAVDTYSKSFSPMCKASNVSRVFLAPQTNYFPIIPSENREYYTLRKYSRGYLYNLYKTGDYFYKRFNTVSPNYYYIKLNETYIPFFGVNTHLMNKTVIIESNSLLYLNDKYNYFIFGLTDEFTTIGDLPFEKPIYDSEKGALYYEERQADKLNKKIQENKWVNDLFCHYDLSAFDPFLYRETLDNSKRSFSFINNDYIYETIMFDQAELENFLREFGIDFYYITDVEPLPEPQPPVNHGEKVRRKLAVNYNTTVEKVARKKKVYDTAISKVRRYPNGNNI